MQCWEYINLSQSWKWLIDNLSEEQPSSRSSSQLLKICATQHFQKFKNETEGKTLIFANNGIFLLAELCVKWNRVVQMKAFSDSWGEKHKQTTHAPKSCDKVFYFFLKLTTVIIRGWNNRNIMLLPIKKVRSEEKVFALPLLGANYAPVKKLGYNITHTEELTVWC